MRKRSGWKTSAAGTPKTGSGLFSVTTASRPDGLNGCELRERLRRATNLSDPTERDAHVERIASVIEHARGY